MAFSGGKSEWNGLKFSMDNLRPFISIGFHFPGPPVPCASTQKPRVQVVRLLRAELHVRARVAGRLFFQPARPNCRQAKKWWAYTQTGSVQGGWAMIVVLQQMNRGRWTRKKDAHETSPPLAAYNSGIILSDIPVDDCCSNNLGYVLILL